MMNYSNLNNLLINNKLILASGSPRRVKLLGDAGIKFKQIIPGIDENGCNWENPYQTASELAQKKAATILEDAPDNSVVLGCDTIVVIGNEVLGKPDSPDRALVMLTKLSGNCHTVCSAVSLQHVNGSAFTDYELTDVYFNQVKKPRLLEYISSGEPLDKAGAYGI
ncbi:MAG: septum formation protein Maf, partial [candidate division Zixibacteria bacterium]|nr:septum formation protein Maf [candidate division Zixibacteria bacterium]